MASRKSEYKDNIVRKSIMRNPEVPLASEQNKRMTLNQAKSSKEYEQKEPAKSLHEPSINKLAEWKKQLSEIKNYQTKEINSMNDISKNTQDFINRAVSSKLNFPPNQPVFKNLPKIEDDRSQKKSVTFQKVVKLPQSKNPNSKDDIQKILDELVESEYRNEEINRRKNFAQSYTDEWLGISKYKIPSFKQQNHKTETQIYHDQLRRDLFRHLFISEDYLSSKVKFDPTLTKMQVKKKQKPKECNCLSDFYAQHSMCS